MKKGFTLAEVLITLGIIGVIAALTAPALIQNAGSAKIGPTLAKAVTTFELANQNMINQVNAPNINAIAGKDTGVYISGLSNFMKVSVYNDSGSSLYKNLLKDYNGAEYSGGGSQIYANDINNALSKGTYAMTRDGLLYVLSMRDLSNLKPQQQSNPNWMNGGSMIDLEAWQRYNELVAQNNTSEAGTVLIDINGKKEPNRIGKDAFVFILMQDGTLRPYGGNQWNTKTEADNKAYNWQNGTKDKCNETEVTSGWTCAGSIYENDLKVIY